MTNNYPKAILWFIFILISLALIIGCNQQKDILPEEGSGAPSSNLIENQNELMAKEACEIAGGIQCGENEVCLTKKVDLDDAPQCCSDKWRCKINNNCCVNQKEATTDNMVLIPSGAFFMGREDREGWSPMANPQQFNDELPLHEVNVNAFYIDKFEITNQQFKEFIDATGYITDAEDIGKSAVMVSANEANEPVQGTDIGWKLIEGATWRNPEGPNSNIIDRMNHPVIHVSWNDASAYAKWIGKRLPTEAEWEKAARGDSKTNWFWSDSIEDTTYPAGKYQNIYAEHRIEYQYPDGVYDGYSGTAPVGSFKPNNYGLYDTSGNVFEWVADWYQYDYYTISPKEDPKGSANGTEKVIKCGSWYLCECFTRPANRNSAEPTRTEHGLGFRLALDAD